MRGMPFTEARAYVNEGEEARQRVNKAIRSVDTYGKPPAQEWQDKALAWSNEAAGRLWDAEGGQALAYLQGRGLKDETIKSARLGYARYKHPKTNRVCSCIVLPWMDAKTVWRVQMRDIRPDVPRDERYFMLPGGSNAGLYLADSLRLKRDLLIMVEGEIDALTLAQECSDLAGVVATGSTKGSRSPQWIGRLARCNRVLIAYDSEQEGEQNAGYWLNALDNATRYRPLEHDVNDMLLQGYDLRAWIGAVLDPGQEVAPATTDDDLIVDAPLCATCLDQDIETVATLLGDDGFMYCAQHRPVVEPLPVENAQEAQEQVQDLGGQSTDKQALYDRLYCSPVYWQSIAIAEGIESDGVTFSLQDGQLHYDANFTLGLDAKRFIFNHRPILIDWLRYRQMIDTPAEAPSDPREQLLMIAERIAAEAFTKGCQVSAVEPATMPLVPDKYRKYIPLTLPDLSRSTCPFEAVVEGKRNGSSHEVRVQVCGEKATHNGWCAKHQHTHTLLALGAELCFAEVHVHECRWIGRGVANWEAYAIRSGAHAMKHDLPTLKAMVDKQKRAYAPA
jgi:hypothetical protein